MEMFLNNKIDFSYCFIAKYDSINKNFREMEEDFENRFAELSNLLLENENSDKLSEIRLSLMFMYD